VTTIAPATAAPAAFAAAATQLKDFAWCDEAIIEALPAPRAIAPYALALEADLADASGRLILLHDPEGNPAWDGDFRLVTFAKAPIDAINLQDVLITDLIWSWLTDALDGHGAPFRAPSGTVTLIASAHYGGLADQPGHCEAELRASWTPDLGADDNLDRHLAAWQDLLLTMAGLPVIAPNVVELAHLRHS
jgi:hypothetical protein